MVGNPAKVRFFVSERAILGHATTTPRATYPLKGNINKTYAYNTRHVFYLGGVTSPAPPSNK